jgi:uncharacterized protein (TIGR02996 family)
MSSDEFALIQAIRAAPADDVPRLVYADYIEERGDEARAEFIRLQCSGLDPARAETLLHQHRERWDEPLRTELLERFPGIRVGTHVVGWSYRRGFISTLEVDAHSINDLPGLPQLVGPIDHIVVHVDADLPAPIDVNWRNWGLNRLKILDYRTGVSSIGELFDKVRIIGRSFRPAHSAVPILRLLTEAPIFEFREILTSVVYALEGELNPVLLVQIQRLPGNASHLCIDPLGLWPLVKGWAETILKDEWRPLPIALDAGQQARVPSARLKHLVRYYQLAGLPPPAELGATPYPQEEREPPTRRGLLTRAARWFRRGR